MASLISKTPEPFGAKRLFSLWDVAEHEGGETDLFAKKKGHLFS